MSGHEAKRSESQEENDPYIEIGRRLELLEQKEGASPKDGEGSYAAYGEDLYTGSAYEGHRRHFDTGYPGGSDPFVF